MKEVEKKPRAICILGMHRSGTSTVTRAVNLLGAYLGQNADLMPPTLDNPEGYWKAILYADVRTGSIQRAIAETDRRRAKQIEFNAQHGITPRSIVKAVGDVMEGARSVQDGSSRDSGADYSLLPPEQAVKRMKKMEAEMMKLARNLEFEQAARLRDEIQKLRQIALGVPNTLVG